MESKTVFFLLLSQSLVCLVFFGGWGEEGYMGRVEGITKSKSSSKCSKKHLLELMVKVVHKIESLLIINLGYNTSKD